MPFKMYNSIYRAAWKDSMEKAKEAEEAEKKMKEEEKQANKQQSRGGRQMSSRQAIDSMRNRGGIIGGDLDLEDVADELGIT